MDDWRLFNQEEYLKGKDWVLKKYIKYRTDWDHDHCEFCHETFSEEEGDLHQGYATTDNYYWICEKCYNDFKDMFKWKLVEGK